MNETNPNGVPQEETPALSAKTTYDYSNCVLPKRAPADFTVRDGIFAVLFLITSVLAADWLLWGGFALGFPILCFLLFALTVVYIGKPYNTVKPFPVLCAVFALSGSLIFALYRDPVMNPAWFFTIAVLYAVFIASVYGKRLYGDDTGMLMDLLRTFVMPLRFFAEPFRSFFAFTRGGKAKRLPQIMVGISLSVPVLLLVIPLLIRSDAAFEGLMQSLFGRIGEITAKIIFGLIIAPFLTAFLFAHKKRIFKDDKKADFGSARILDKAAATTLMGVINCIYGIYVFAQFAYFFSAFSGILPDGYTFTLAGYARRGFFELCAVCAVNLMVIVAVTSFCKRGEDGKLPLPVRILGVLICAFSLLLTASALSKMGLYISAFGMTRLRIITSVFMLFIAVLLLVTGVKLFVPKLPCMRLIVTAWCVIALTVGYADIDTVIARYNVGRYQNGTLEQFDVSHLGTLSDSAVPYLTELLDSKDEKVRNDAADCLYDRLMSHFTVETESGVRITKLTRNQTNGFSSYNVSSAKASNLLEEHADRIAEIHFGHMTPEEIAGEYSDTVDPDDMPDGTYD